jgi:hypothetical protein
LTMLELRRHISLPHQNIFGAQDNDRLSLVLAIVGTALIISVTR